MPVDLDTDEDGRLYADEFGDYATVSGDENVKAQIRNAVAAQMGDSDLRSLTQAAKRQLRRDIRRGLEQLEYVNRVIAIKIYPITDDEIRIDVQTESDDISFTV